MPDTAKIIELKIQPTGHFDQVHIEQCRVWRGHDQDGTEVLVFVRAIQPLTHDQDNLDVYDQSLRRLPEPTLTPPLPLKHAKGGL